MEKRDNLKILVYLIGSLGDSIVAIPALQALRRHYGRKAEIYILHDIQPDTRVTPDQLLINSTLVNGFISYKFETMPLQRFWPLIRLWVNLIKYRFNAVVYLAASERSLISVVRDKLFFMLCLIPQRIGFHALELSFTNPRRLNKSIKVKHESIYRLERLRLSGIDVSKEEDLSNVSLQISSLDLENMRSILAKKRKYPDRPLVAICPGTITPSKQWPVERFIEIGRRLLEQNKFELIIIGGPKENKIGEQMIKEWGTGINTAGCLSVFESALTFKLCAFSIGLDTGATHLAAVSGIPSIAIYSQRDYPGRWYPLGNKYTIVTHHVVCAGCLKKVCPVQGHPCMNGISVDDVWQAVTSLISKNI